MSASKGTLAQSLPGIEIAIARGSFPLFRCGLLALPGAPSFRPGSRLRLGCGQVLADPRADGGRASVLPGVAEPGPGLLVQHARLLFGLHVHKFRKSCSIECLCSDTEWSVRKRLARPKKNLVCGFYLPPGWKINPPFLVW